MGEWIAVEGLDGLNRALRRAETDGIVKAVGRANKRIGRKFIDEWLHPSPKPSAVGAGAGAKVRPSAAKREMKLRVGGKHRAGNTPYMQWGKRPVREPGVRAPERPFIVGSVMRHREQIFDAWLDAISDELREAGGIDKG